MEYRNRLAKVIEEIQDRSIAAARKRVADAVAAGRVEKTNGRDVPWVLASTDGNGAKRSYGSYFTGPGLGVILMVGGGH